MAADVWILASIPSREASKMPGIAGTARWDEITWVGTFFGAINGMTP
jgi:hypothetical protein